MAPPKITLTLEPAEGLGLAYARLAPWNSTDGFELMHIVVRLDAVSQESLPITMTALTIDGNPPYATPLKSISLTAATPDGPNNALTGVGAKGLWEWWGGPFEYVLTVPAPLALKLTLSFNGFDPLTEVRLLAPHTTPYQFPLRKDALKDGEFYQGLSAAHVPGVVGWSSFAYDLVAVRYDAASSSWTELMANGSPSNPANYLAYGRQVHAMATGKVVSVRNDVPDEPISATLPPWTQFEHLDQPNPQLRPISGNHVKILCDNGELLTHAHLRQGTVSVALNATLKAGDPIGQVGNSGQSARPNLMIGCSRFAKGVPLPLSFAGICVLARNEYDPKTSSGHWYAITEPRALPALISLIWPDAKPPVPPDPPAPRHVLPPEKWFAAVDPLSLIVSMSIYQMLTKPRPSLKEEFNFDVLELMRRLDDGRRRELQARLDAVKQYVQAAQKAAVKPEI